MPVWEELREQIASGSVPSVLDLLASLDDEGRKEIGRELPAYVRSRDDALSWRTLESSALHIEQNTALKAAGAACLPAAAAASWLLRRELRPRTTARFQQDVAVMRAAETRPASWRADVGRRMAARLRLHDMQLWDRTGELNWEIAAQLLASAGEAPPADDAFVVGWLVWRRTAPFGRDPFFPALVPSIFEAEGVGAELADERPDENGTWSPTGSWIGRLLAAAAVDTSRASDDVDATGSADTARAAAEPMVDREALLDGCMRRFLRGGKTRDLAWFVRLHHALDPAIEESAARLRDYVRLLPTAPPAVAELAFDEIKDIDERTPLDDGLFIETVEALLFRPEPRFVKAALIWLDRRARGRGCEAAAVAFAAGLFGHERPELRERAVKLAVKYAGKADPLTAETVREAARALPGTLLPLVVAEFGAVEAAEPEAPPVLYAPVPTDLPGPIGSPAELFEETVLHLQNHDMSWAEMERLLAGLVTMGPAIVEELRQYTKNKALYLWDKYRARYLYGPDFLVHVLLQRYPRRTLRHYRGEMIAEYERMSLGFPAPAHLLHRRFLDAASLMDAPVLLATPTSSTGHVDPDVFAARLRTLEEAGEEPGVYDLEQALLRLPADTVRVPGLEGLSSPAAVQAREWLASGGFRAPDLTYGFVPIKHHRYDWTTQTHWTEVSRFHAGSTCDSGLSAARLLGTIAPPTDENEQTGRHASAIAWWPSVLPSHRELTAAHLLHHLAIYDHAAVLPALADATGPTGQATAAVLLLGLGSEHAPDRAEAVDALLSFAAQNALPTSDMGRLFSPFLEADAFPFTRLLPPLTDAVRAGAPLWPLFAEAIPALLPEPGTPARTGLAPFLSLATTTAELHHIRTPLPALTTWTPASPTSHPAKEAARLHQTLTTP